MLYRLCIDAWRRIMEIAGSWGAGGGVTYGPKYSHVEVSEIFKSILQRHIPSSTVAKNEQTN